MNASRTGWPATARSPSPPSLSSPPPLTRRRTPTPNALHQPRPRLAPLPTSLSTTVRQRLLPSTAPLTPDAPSMQTKIQ